MSPRIRHPFALMFLLAVAAALVVTSALAAPPTGRGQAKGHGWGKGAYAQLNLTDRQRSRIEAIMADHRAKVQRLRQSNLSEDQKMAKRAELRQDMMSKINAVLTPEQRTELKAARVDRRQDRREGIRDCVSRLNLTNDQKARIKSIRQDSQAKVQAVRSNSNLTQQQKRAQVMEIRKNTRRKVLSELTPAQREQVRNCEATRGRGKGLRAGAPG